jgi:hypothetical protein
MLDFQVNAVNDVVFAVVTFLDVVQLYRCHERCAGYFDLINPAAAEFVYE